MAQGFDQTGEYLRSLSRKQVVWILSVLIPVAVMLAYCKVVRPNVDLIYSPPEIYAVNKGKADAFISRIDGFLFWKGQIAYIGNMPEVRQMISKGAVPEGLTIEGIPSIEPLGAMSEPYYLKLAVRYQMPGFPVFRYTSLLYLEFSPARFSWKQVKSIPAKYRSLGNLGVGKVNVIQLNYH
jgi:hypothetical protein